MSRKKRQGEREVERERQSGSDREEKNVCFLDLERFRLKLDIYWKLVKERRRTHFTKCVFSRRRVSFKVVVIYYNSPRKLFYILKLPLFSMLCSLFANVVSQITQNNP